ncbi:helix-turn-helix domain-containing protein [Pseudonocardia adelaidensis]|uniref:Helix-turn-helix transcriptional regulator n=1 Tax=Pseudonocardia adelaidensis TaxID=648754 RepID=A0ABP9NKI5_9PSEU
MSPEDPELRAIEQLTAALRGLRADAGVSGADLAGRIGTSQATISRYESGRLLPSMLVAGRIAWALRAPKQQRQRLVELARAAAEERAGLVPKRVLLQQGVAQLQRRIRLEERRARHIRAFHPSIVPGLLQTEGYMRAIVSGPPATSEAENEAWMRERLARQLHMSQPGRTAVQIVAEAALHWGVAGGAVMAEQCAHLAELAVKRPAWRVGVVPRVPAEPVPLFVTNGFTIHDSTSVHIGTTAGNALVTDPDVVADHIELFDRLEEIARFGEDAAAIFTGVAGLYRL